MDDSNPYLKAPLEAELVEAAARHFELGALACYSGTDLPRRAVHGDFNTGTNILLAEDGERAIVDFDFLDVHERVFEIAYSMFFAMGSIEWGVDLAARDWSRIARSVDWYDRTAAQPLSEAEWRALPIELARVPLYWVATAGFHADPVQQVLDEAQGVEQAHWVLGELGALLER